MILVARNAFEAYFINSAPLLEVFKYWAPFDINGEYNSIPHDLNKPFRRKVYAKYDCIIHAAAISPIDSKNDASIFYNNISSTQNLVDFANQYKVKKIVYAASSSCYGIPKKYPTKKRFFK